MESPFPLPNAFKETLRGADLIIHLGDITEFSFIDSLKEIAPVEAISGNMDDPYIANLLPIEKVFTIEGLTLVAFHGWGPPDGLEKRVYNHFESKKPDVILFGHSHEPMIYWHNDILLFNPGSLTRPRHGLPTLGFLTIVKKEITTEIRVCTDLMIK